MAYIINIPDSEWSSQAVTLGNKIYKIELKYKSRTQRWYLSLSDNNKTTLLTEKKLVSNMFLTEPYALDSFTGGLIVERIFGDADYPSRNNLGLGKEFELKYLSADETALMIQISKDEAK
ncbi:hypothetical protein OYT40_002162 [Escherichia coli]|nr:hypothetical protein [Escherichia coli]